jgi:hypothetical protein
MKYLEFGVEGNSKMNIVANMHRPGGIRADSMRDLRTLPSHQLPCHALDERLDRGCQDIKEPKDSSLPCSLHTIYTHGEADLILLLVSLVSGYFFLFGT